MRVSGPAQGFEHAVRKGASAHISAALAHLGAASASLRCARGGAARQKAPSLHAASRRAPTRGCASTRATSPASSPEHTQRARRARGRESGTAVKYLLQI